VLEHLLVTAGAMEAGPVEAPVTLGAGDLATFPGDVPHAYRGLKPGTLAVLVMDYP
jgi:quercetin dioxygenase-like cupin family protein